MRKWSCFPMKDSLEHITIFKETEEISGLWPELDTNQSVGGREVQRWFVLRLMWLELDLGLREKDNNYYIQLGEYCYCHELDAHVCVHIHLQSVFFFLPQFCSDLICLFYCERQPTPWIGHKSITGHTLY